MFTGIVEETGRVLRVDSRGGYRRIRIQAQRVLEGTAVGDSISVDGACQTGVWLEEHAFEIETLQESLDKTTLGGFRTGTIVNLERAALPSTRLGGHLVQGHVDTSARIMSVREDSDNVYLETELIPELAALVVSGGSITIDGVSLTVAAVSGSSFTVNIIPHTWSETALRRKAAGDRVNIETDIIGRYVARMLSLRSDAGSRNAGIQNAGSGHSGLRISHLQEAGYVDA